MSDRAYVIAQTQQKTFIRASPKSGLLQRTCACGQHTIAGGECEKCRQKREGMMQHTAVSPAPMRSVPPVVHEVLFSQSQPLDADTRAFMEPRFGQDFTQVRVHTDAKAAESARAVNALAYTVGRDVVFGAGQYAPQTRAGRRLMAHELTHVFQQQAAPKPQTTNLSLGPANDRFEGEAEQVARNVTTSDPMERSSAHNEGDVKIGEGITTGLEGIIQRQFITPLGQGGGFGGLMERDRQRKPRTFALTFDDGPHTAELGTGKNLTEKVLDTLKAKSIKAGFFVQTGVSYRGASRIGKTLIARMHAEGHKVGIHTGGTVEHELHTTAQKAGRLEGELEAAKKYISTETGEVPTLVRPPKGILNKDVLATYTKVNLTNLLWDMDGDQGKNLPLDTLKARIFSEMLRVQQAGWKPTTSSPHIVVLYHDIQRGTAENLGALIEEIIATTKNISGGKDSAAFEAP